MVVRAAVRWLRSTHDRLMRIHYRLSEAGILLGDVDHELTSIARQCRRWADRLDSPAVQEVDEDAETNPVILKR